MKISFLDFWDGFDPKNNFLYYLFRDIYNDLEVVDPIEAELIIFSVFGIKSRIYNHCKKIFFTGENKRPNFEVCDYSISFDFDDYNGRNIRIPLWYYYIDWFSVGNYSRPSYLIPENFLYEPNEFSKKKKINFCSTVYSNPVPLRERFVTLLSQYKKVDCFGKVFGFSRLPDGEKEKLDLISNYKFNICFENSIYPGYYTEKLLHAKIAGCIPIYFSDEKINYDFYDDYILRINDEISEKEILETVKEIDSDDKKFKIYSESPIFTKKIDLEEIKNRILKTLV